MLRKARTALFLVFSLAAHASARPWKSSDGQHSIEGEFVKRDATSVTISRSDGKQTTIPLDKLHPDDRAWLNAEHPLPGQGKAAKKDNTPPNSAAVFDKLVFGDTRDEVLKKLLTSEFVELTVDEAFLGRTGLNDVFRTRHKIGGLDATLFFDWDAGGQLKEVSLQTASFPAKDFNDKLHPCWKEFAALLVSLYGKPVHPGIDLNLSSINKGSLSPTHLWTLENNNSAILGAAREGDQYQIVVRFSRKTVQPFMMP